MRASFAELHNLLNWSAFNTISDRVADRSRRIPTTIQYARLIDTRPIGISASLGTTGLKTFGYDDKYHG